MKPISEHIVWKWLSPLTESIFREIPTIIDWILSNLDSFRMISFQPVTPIGRMVDLQPDSITLDAVWEQICVSVGRAVDLRSVPSEADRHSRPESYIR